MRSDPPYLHAHCQSVWQRGYGRKGRTASVELDPDSSRSGTHTYTPAPKHPLRDGLKPRARIIWALAVDVPATRDRDTHTTRVSKRAVPRWVVRE